MFGFVGKVEYRHAYSRSGGAQYGRSTSAANDVLIVYAEAFERDSDPEEFSLEAILAHECGHQIQARHPRIAKRVAGATVKVEEILASLLGAMICDNETDRENLFLKAISQLIAHGQDAEVAQHQLEEL